MGSMEPFSINELGGLVTVCAGACATILFAISKSKCSRVRCCCMELERPLEAIVRDPPPDAERPSVDPPQP